MNESPNLDLDYDTITFALAFPWLKGAVLILAVGRTAEEFRRRTRLPDLTPSGWPIDDQFDTRFACERPM